jgi:hypothetical protein
MKRLLMRQLPGYLIASATLPHGAWAAPDSGTGEIARVEVVGMAPLPELDVERESLPYPVQLVTDKALRKSGGENRAEFMTRNLTGVNVNEVSGSPLQIDVTFRGFRASPVLGSAQGISVYLDGVRVNEAFGDVINWYMLPEPAIGSLLLVPSAKSTTTTSKTARTVSTRAARRSSPSPAVLRAKRAQRSTRAC